MTVDALPPGAHEADAIDAAANTLRAFLDPWLPARVHGSTLDSQIRTAAALVIRDAAPHLAAAEREACAQIVESLRPQAQSRSDLLDYAAALLRRGGEGGPG